MNNPIIVALDVPGGAEFLLGVTVLTSFDESDLADPGYSRAEVFRILEEIPS